MSLSVSCSMLSEMHCFAEPGNTGVTQRHKRLHFVLLETDWYTIVWKSDGLIQPMVTCVVFWAAWTSLVGGIVHLDLSVL